MPSQNEGEEVGEKEKALVVSIQALDHKDRGAYAYFLKAKQAPIALDTADELFQLYLQGASCDDIRKGAGAAFGHGQIVAARVQYAWDARRDEYRRNLVARVPARAQQVHLEQADFVADLLTISRVAIQKKIRKAMASGKPEDLEGIPIPTNVKDLRELLDMFIKVTGQDKKRIEVSGNVTVDNKTGVATKVTSATADAIMDELLDAEEVEPIDVPATPAPKKLTSATLAKTPVPKTAEEMITFLIGTGVSEEKARALVESMNNDVKRYSDLVLELIKTKPEDVN